jgi:hypothetical protein
VGGLGLWAGSGVWGVVAWSATGEQNHSGRTMNHENSASVDASDFPVRDPWVWRVRTFVGKLAAVLASCVVASLAAGGAELLADVDNQMIFWFVFAPLIYGLTRVFRGADESDAPRSWWRMTARPTASLMLGGVPAFWILLKMMTTEVSSGELIAALPVLGLCALYLNSALYLMKGR